jgi:RNase adaptor protein for sRNA GlmZ degradation
MATAQMINKGISYQMDTKGKKTAVVFDLKNKAVQEIMEDILDLLTVKERQNDEKIDFFQATDKILKLKN